ncbi:hypothetical protein DPMN_148413 [Dreissena polymorpha]|uniref:Uncharacterized protein n=1 Tax=Dreissena polymorpha TaxID=45954 RepID=A0A9D4F9T0_DREPO|nr:hypothetical protein DPMN_148413 [Dreissena polymorpha]
MLFRSDWFSLIDSYQKTALRRIPKGHLVLETDAPYFRLLKASASTPDFIAKVALVVRRVRVETAEEVLEFTLVNTRILYQM